MTTGQLHDLLTTWWDIDEDLDVAQQAADDIRTELIKRGELLDWDDCVYGKTEAELQAMLIELEASVQERREHPELILDRIDPSPEYLLERVKEKLAGTKADEADDAEGAD
jgi:hypothetical protein